MIKIILLILIGVITFKVFALLKPNTTNNSSPKASREIYVGNHIENLAAHDLVNVSPIGNIRELDNLPLWFSKDSNSRSPEIYSGLFWEIEPTGEYIYYLAGDFAKNEKGLMRYGTANTSLFVEVNFEDDVINVAKSDGLNEQNTAEKQSEAIDFIRDLTLEELSQRVSTSTHKYDHRVAFVSLKKLLNENSKGYGRLVISKPPETQKAYISLIYQEFLEPVKEGQYPRYTKIEVKTKVLNTKMEILIKQYLDLVNKYSNMPYVSLSGTTRA